jgi:NAD(P)-dependent dehydrogenase (short-subunit alcohol dehydrogenase family)
MVTMAESGGKGALQDLNVLITGGGTGIGRGIAHAFAAEGARLVLAGRRKEPLEETAAELRAAGSVAQALTADVCDPAQCSALVEAASQALGGLHILVNNAGIARFGALDRLPDEEILNMVSVNLTAAMFMSKYAIPELRKHGKSGVQGGASILNIGTSATEQPIKNFGVYSAAKAGLEFFSRALALDLAPDRIRVNCISPGVVETPIHGTMIPPDALAGVMDGFARQTPLGRVGQPVDIARAAVFLCTPASDWITGARLTVDGGISLT